MAERPPSISERQRTVFFLLEEIIERPEKDVSLSTSPTEGGGGEGGEGGKARDTHTRNSLSNPRVFLGGGVYHRAVSEE